MLRVEGSRQRAEFFQPAVGSSTDGIATSDRICERKYRFYVAQRGYTQNIVILNLIRDLSLYRDAETSSA